MWIENELSDLISMNRIGFQRLLKNCALFLQRSYEIAQIQGAAIIDVMHPFIRALYSLEQAGFSLTLKSLSSALTISRTFDSSRVRSFISTDLSRAQCSSPPCVALANRLAVDEHASSHRTVESWMISGQAGWRWY